MSEDIPRTFTTSYEKRKQLFEHIKMLVRPEQEHILKILKKCKENYTENSNGIFFDLMGICDITFNAIEEYLSFCLKNREEDKERIDEMDKLRNENYISSDDENSIENNIE